jgi:hypothetical protein
MQNLKNLKTLNPFHPLLSFSLSPQRRSLLTSLVLTSPPLALNLTPSRPQPPHLTASRLTSSILTSRPHFSASLLFSHFIFSFFTFHSLSLFSPLSRLLSPIFTLTLSLLSTQSRLSLLHYHDLTEFSQSWTHRASRL